MRARPGRPPGNRRLRANALAKAHSRATVYLGPASGRPLEALARRPDDPGADLAAVAAGQADVHDGQHAGFERLEDVHARRRPAEAEQRDLEGGVLARRDPVHLEVARDHAVRGAALVVLERERAGLREAAEPDGLGDRALAAHPGDLGLVVPGEQLALVRRRRPPEPLAAQARAPDGELLAAARLFCHDSPSV